MKKKLIISVLGLASIGALAGLSSTASALNCSTPAIPVPNGSTDVLPVNSIVTIGCAGSGESAEMESLATTNSVRARLIAGTQAQTIGFNSARQLLTGCQATDNTTGAGSVLDTSGCTGVAFKVLFVTHFL